MKPATRRENAPTPGDVELVRRLLTGDESALAALYDRYAGLVYSVANRILRDAGAAEEVLQDIFHQLWRTAASFDFGRGSLPGWLLVTSRNRSIDRLRRRRVLPGEAPERPVVVPFDLESLAAQSEAMARVRAAMEALPAPQRATVELAYFEGLTHTEIALRTGDPLGTVKTRLRTALASLRQALGS